jgi:glycine/D-amino acid oxidase-like deaminating enzyme
MILEESSWGLEQSKAYPKLNENIEADVAIIGAGFAGIFAAFVLSKAGIKAVVLEKNDKILQNATMRTTAFITKIIDTPFAELVDIYGLDRAKLVWESGQDAINLIAQIVKEENIDCEFKNVPSFTYAQDEKEFEGLTREYEAIKNSGFEAVISKDFGKLNFKNSGYLEIPEQAIFHPIKFAQRLAELAESAGVRIFTNSEALSIEGSTVKTEAGSVSFKDVLIATYYPFTQEKTHYKKAMYVSYVYEVEIPKGLMAEGLYFDKNNPYHYFRIDSYASFDRMIIGGEDHRKELKINPAKSFGALEKYVKNVLGSNAYKITRKWSGQILESIDGLALIGEIKLHTFVATGFSGNGITYSAVSATLVRDLILRQGNPYVQLYDPKRTPTINQLSRKGLDYTGEFFGGAFKNFFSAGQRT